MDNTKKDDLEGIPFDELHFFESTYNPMLSRLDDFGLWQLTINSAAELVVIDMWFSGEFPEIKEPEDFAGDQYDPILKSLLFEQIKTFEDRLMTAVACGKLKTSRIERDFNERVNIKKTYVTYYDLAAWLEERGYEYGDIFDEWIQNEAELFGSIADEVMFRRAKSQIKDDEISRIAYSALMAKHEKNDVNNIEEFRLNEIRKNVKSLIVRNQQLREEIQNSPSCTESKIDRPLSLRQRRSLLTIIAAICDFAKIDYSARGSSQRIKEMTEKIGIAIDDGTIKKIIDEIPDALETRMK